MHASPENFEILIIAFLAIKITQVAGGVGGGGGGYSSFLEGGGGEWYYEGTCM